MYPCNFASGAYCTLSSPTTLSAPPTNAVTFGYAVAAFNNLLAVSDSGSNGTLLWCDVTELCAWTVFYVLECSAYNTCAYQTAIAHDPSITGDGNVKTQIFLFWGSSFSICQASA